MKKNIILVLALVLALSLAGCGSKAVEEPKTEPEQEAVVEDIAPAPTEVTPEVVEEEPEAEEVPVEEPEVEVPATEKPEVEDPFAKYDEGEFYGADIYTALDEFKGQPVAILVTTGRYNFALYDYLASNYNAIVDGAYKDPGTNTYLVLYNDGSYESNSDIGSSCVISKKSDEQYLVGKLSEETPAYTDEGYLRGEYATEDNSASMVCKIEDDEFFTSHLIKDENKNTIGILFKSNYKITNELNGYMVFKD